MSFTLIRNGTLIDGSGRDPVPDAAILIEDERIRALGPAASVRLPDAPIQQIDAAGGTLMPGLIDSHVHLMLEGVVLQRMLTTPFSKRFYDAIPRMRRTLAAGVTSVRDAGGADLGLKQAIAEGIVAGPRLQISTSILTITGGHADFWLRSGTDIELLPSHPGLPAGRCDGIDGVRRKVREVLRAGAEVVKICSTGGVMSPTDHPEFSQFSPEELDVIVREAAARRGVKVMAHAQGSEGIKNALRAGVHSIEHGIYLDDEAIELLLERDAFLVPTLLAPRSVLEASESGDVPDYALAKTREVIDAHRDSIGRAHAAGVKIAMGTDAGVMPHGSNLRELGLLVEIGMSPMEAIVAGTRTAAACLGWDDRVGTLEAGKLADVVIARADPLANIRALEDPTAIALVLKGGEVVAGSARLPAPGAAPPAPS